MIDTIRALEAQAQQLEPDAATRQQLLAAVSGYGEAFLEHLPEAKAYERTEDKGRALWDHPIAEDPADLAEILDLFRDQVDRPGLNPASGGHLGYIPGGGLYPAALGDYLAAVTNRYAGVFFASPGAVRLENQLIRWMASLMGYPATATGNLASGGSVANLIAIATARDAKGLKAVDFPRAVIYLSGQAHHCISKGVRLAGLGECTIRVVPTDDRFRMDTQALANALEEDKAQGKLPFLIIGSIGTTDTGAVDPIPKMADLAKQHNCWLHVDAAYGGFFVLCEELKAKFKGIERSDSVVIDPHKGLFLPYGLGAVLVRDTEHLRQSNQYHAHYLQDTVTDTEELSPAELSPELSKHFRGLRLWLPLKLFGVQPFRAGLMEKVWLCRYFYREVQAIPGFEVGPEPELSVMIFRYVP
ncbi:MAG: aminotransferase class I/II-fold pyridoxal phosphate-dependent enzyme, partial [Bacteroidota bacterium]